MRRIKDKYGDIVSSKEIICINIPDEYEYVDEELINLLESSVSL